MKPLKLTIQGFGSYASPAQVIDFTVTEQNIFLITGDTGAGKSTIFDAIVFALYGQSAQVDKAKAGRDFQSQFSGFDVTPFVELEFSEMRDGREEVYKIRRVPTHVRLKERGGGTTKGDPEAILTFPDGAVVDRPIDAVNAHIIDIVKLDSSQFRKVAMLAQGEFMAMLSANSNEKKQIFRGLFDTEIYLQIAKILQARAGELRGTLDSLASQFRAGASQINAVSGDKTGLVELVAAIADSPSLDSVVAKNLIDALETEIARADEQLKILRAEQTTLKTAKDNALRELEAAKSIDKAYKELDAATITLKNLAKRESEVEDKISLVAKIDAAFDIQAAHVRYLDARRAYLSAKTSLEEAEKKQPSLTSAATQAKAKLEEAASKKSQSEQYAASLKSALDSEFEAISEVRSAELRVSQIHVAYASAKDEYGKAHSAFDEANKVFLDSQAGYIAQSLSDGEPCPVCGSIEHPHPHVAVSEDISQDKVNELQSAQEKASENLAVLSAESGQAIQDLENAKDALASAKRSLQKDFLDAFDALEKLGDDAPLPDIQAVLDELNKEATQASDEASETYSEALNEVNSAKVQLETSAKIISDTKDSLPELEERASALKRETEAKLEEKGSAGDGWQEIVSAHKKDEIARLRKEIDEHNNLQAEAKGQKAAAKKLIGSSVRPDIETLQKAYDESSQKLNSIDSQVDDLNLAYTTNARLLEGMRDSFAEWRDVNATYEMTENLYKRLAGTKSGQRMDLETFVQRFYFSQILVDANRRFQEMTNQEYEFRMVDASAAGAGSNKGLDILVYSSVTDSVREIKTLSGGESFMAALSFALGLSDQIVAKKSAVNLDIMFIDEGFGSLDDNARKLAVDTLRAMTSSKRTIGIISHVAELKSAIDDQLVVTKDANGSHAKWVGC